LAATVAVAAGVFVHELDTGTCGRTVEPGLDVVAALGHHLRDQADPGPPPRPSGHRRRRSTAAATNPRRPTTWITFRLNERATSPSSRSHATLSAAGPTRRALHPVRVGALEGSHRRRHRLTVAQRSAGGLGGLQQGVAVQPVEYA
jgi:hypothetical protein